MAVTFIINGRATEATPGLSLFEHAEKLGVQVPTSCNKQGKCKECMVEVVEGAALLSPISEQEQHLKGNFRLSCRTYITGEAGAGEGAQVRCHTMRRGN